MHRPCADGTAVLGQSWLAYQITTGLSTQTYFYSQYALYSQTAAAILSLLSGVGLLALIVSEVYGSRLDRAFRDNLSGLLGRDAFVAAICDGEYVAQTWSKGCFMLADLDRFKAINDNFGHAAGDLVISTFGRLLLKAAPSQSLCGRFGGEEFAVLLPETDLSTACAIAREVCNLLEGTPICICRRYALHVSIGITMYVDRDPFSSVLHVQTSPFTGPNVSDGTAMRSTFQSSIYRRLYERYRTDLIHLRID